MNDRRRRSRLFAGLALAIGTGLIVALVLAVASGVHLSRLAWNEPRELVQQLGIQPGMRVADVGAGSGWLATEVARRIGPEGHVFATEISQARLADVRAAVSAAGLANVTVLEAGSAETGLPRACCDVIYLRYVYHHLARPAAINASLYESLAPGGRLAIIDFEPRGVFAWIGPGAPGREGHGVWRQSVREELAAAGFQPVDEEERWGRLGYLLVFRR